MINTTLLNLNIKHIESKQKEDTMATVKKPTSLINRMSGAAPNPLNLHIIRIPQHPSRNAPLPGEKGDFNHPESPLILGRQDPRTPGTDPDFNPNTPPKGIQRQNAFGFDTPENEVENHSFTNGGK